jgi:hypothetical protein
LLLTPGGISFSSVGNTNLICISYVILSSAHPHIFCNTSSLPLFTAQCQAVFPLLSVANKFVFVSYFLRFSYPNSIFSSLCLFCPSFSLCARWYFVCSLWLITTYGFFLVCVTVLVQIPYDLKYVYFAILCSPVPGGISLTVCGQKQCNFYLFCCIFSQTPYFQKCVYFATFSCPLLGGISLLSEANNKYFNTMLTGIFPLYLSQIINSK